MQQVATSHNVQHIQSGAEYQQKQPSGNAEHNNYSTMNPPCDRISQVVIKALHQYEIKILYGEKKDIFATTSKHTIYRFQPNNFPDQELLFKPEFAFHSAKPEKTQIEDNNAPVLTKTFHNAPVRNILCSLFAKELGLEHLLPEYSLGIANDQTGVVMTEIKGTTVHQWLIDDGYLERKAQISGVNNETLQILVNRQRPYQDATFLKLMHEAFNFAIEEKGLSYCWREIKFLDFMTGQCDRGNLSNIIITSDSNGHPNQLIAIDNDLTFPIENNSKNLHFPPIPPSGYSRQQVDELSIKFLTFTAGILPEALPALKIRLDRFKNLWLKDTEDTVCFKTIGNRSLSNPTIPLRSRLCQFFENLGQKLICSSPASDDVYLARDDQRISSRYSN